jgi:hypothetical protein
MCEIRVGRLESVEGFVLCCSRESCPRESCSRGSCLRGSCSRGTILVAGLKREHVRRGGKTWREVRCEKTKSVGEKALREDVEESKM